MPDISMCPGGSCSERTRCYRATAIPSELQVYFTFLPLSPDDSCDYYIPLEKNTDENK